MWSTGLGMASILQRPAAGFVCPKFIKQPWIYELFEHIGQLVADDTVAAEHSPSYDSRIQFQRLRMLDVDAGQTLWICPAYATGPSGMPCNSKDTHLKLGEPQSRRHLGCGKECQFW